LHDVTPNQLKEQSMPSTPVRAAAEGLPNISRRSILTGIATLSATGVATAAYLAGTAGTTDDREDDGDDREPAVLGETMTWTKDSEIPQEGERWHGRLIG
jgi:hypothetical protein